MSEVTVVVLERDRHENLIGELREAGARVNLIRDGDVAPSIAASLAFTGVDMLMGVGGTPEGVISAAAIKCAGGAIQAKLWPRNDEERQALVDDGFDLDRVLRTDDLVAGEDVFVAATGVTRGALLNGVRVSSARRRDAVARDALALRHPPLDLGFPPVRQGAELDEGRTRWIGMSCTRPPGRSSPTTAASSPPTRARERSRSASTRSRSSRRRRTGAPTATCSSRRPSWSST